MYNRRLNNKFLGPFILGGITGGILAPNFYPRPFPIYYPPIPMPIYNTNYPYYPRPY